MTGIVQRQEQLQQLEAEWLAHFNKIMADDVINYPESMDTRGFLATHESNLKTFEADVIAELETLRDLYRDKGVEVAKQLSGKRLSAEIHRLRAEYQEKLQPYRDITSRVKLLILEIPPNREHIEKLIADYEAEMNSAIDDFDKVVYDDFWGVDQHEKHLRQQLDRWEHLLKAVTDRLNSKDTPSAQKAYDRGVQATLQMVMKEIRSILER